MVESLLTDLVNWLIKNLLTASSYFIKLIFESTSTDILNDELVVFVLTAVEKWGKIIVVTSVILAIIKSVMIIAEGQKINVLSSIRAWIVSIVLAFWGLTLGKTLYLFGSFVGTKLVEVIKLKMSTDAFTYEGTTFVGGAVVSLILVCVLLYMTIKLFFNVLERSGQYFISVCTMYLYLSMYAYGNEQSYWSWLKQIFSISFAQSLMVIGAYVGMNMFGAQKIFMAIGIFFSLNKIDHLLGSFSAPVGGSTGRMFNTLSTTAHQMNMIRMFRGGK